MEIYMHLLISSESNSMMWVVVYPLKDGGAERLSDLPRVILLRVELYSNASQLHFRASSLSEVLTEYVIRVLSMEVIKEQLISFLFFFLEAN